jgi:hypothetical protein
VSQKLKEALEIEEEKRHEKITTDYQMMLIKMMILFMAPVLIPTILVQYMFFIARFDVWVSISVCMIVACATVMTVYMIIQRTGSYLHGRKMLILTFRDAPGDYWSDFALIKTVKPVAIVGKTLSNPVSSSIYEYEITFEDFPMMERMILLSPCPWERLLIFTPQQVFFKGLIVGGQAAILAVTKVREFEMEGERIPVVIAKDSDWEAETSQKMSKIFEVDKEIVDQAISKYDAFRAIFYKQVLATREAELESALESLKDAESKAGELAAKMVEEYIELEKAPPREKITRKWKYGLIAIAIIVVSVIVFILMTRIIVLR